MSLNHLFQISWCKYRLLCLLLRKKTPRRLLSQLHKTHTAQLFSRSWPQDWDIQSMSRQWAIRMHEWIEWDGSTVNGTLGVLGLRCASGCQVKVQLVCVLAQQDDPTKAVSGEHPRHPARRHWRLGLVIVSQPREHGVVVHLIFFLRVLLVLFHLEGDGSPYVWERRGTEIQLGDSKEKI